MKITLPPSLSRRLDSHLLTCSAVVAGVTSFSATRAEAAIVYSGIVNAPIAPQATNGGMYFDFEVPGTISQGATFANWDINPYASGSKIYIAGNVRIVVDGTNTALNLLGGTSIGPASLYNTSEAVFTTPIAAGSTGFVGFRFTSNNTGGTTPLYGWARLSPAASGNGTTVDFAYETSGAAIAAGAVPEPSTLGLLALGSLGLTQMRRRRLALAA